MNEIEARGKIKYRIANEMRKAGENKEEYEDLEIALQVMKEIREYREIGSVEEFKALKENQRKCEDCAGCTVWKCDCANERAYAIDEFANFIHKKAKENNGLRLSSETRSWTHTNIFDYVNEFRAEQMKGGATDERICRKTD